MAKNAMVVVAIMSCHLMIEHDTDRPNQKKLADLRGGKNGEKAKEIRKWLCGCYSHHCILFTGPRCTCAVSAEIARPQEAATDI